MSYNFYFVILLSVFLLSNVHSQSPSIDPAVESPADTIKYSLNANLQYELSARPKDAWEFGLHFGHFFIDGDVDTRIPGGYGLGVHLRKAINYTFSLRMDLFYGSARGLDPQPSASNLLPEQNVFTGYGPENPWFFSHKTRYIFGAVEGIINIGNILFHSGQNKWNFYLGMGVGLDNHQAMLDLRDGNGNVYTDLIAQSGYTEELFDTRSGRREIKSALKSIYDGDFETEGPKKQGIFRLGDDTNIHVVFIGSLGLAKKLSRRVNLALEHNLFLSDNDYLDGQKWRTNLDQSNNVDVGHYTALRLGINLGNFNKRSEPLYWMNPIEVALQSIKKIDFEILDSDCDGVPDQFDLETTSCDDPCMPVDTRGRSLDSDRDGIADCRDCEPHSPPGFPVNECGKVVVETHTHDLDTTGILEFIQSKCPLCETPDKCKEDWYLPMVNFDLDRHTVKPEFFSHLYHVGTAMNECPDICMIVKGFTDNRHSNDYNLLLSYRRAKAVIDYLVDNFNLSRNRFILKYGGEEQPIIENLPDRKVSRELERQHFINRRVELSICDCSVQHCGEEMEMPKTGERSGTGGGDKSKSNN